MPADASGSQPSAPARSQEELLTISEALPIAKFSQDDLDKEKDRQLRESFMDWMVRILIGQLAFVNVAIVSLASVGLIKLEEWTLRLWIGGTLLEVFGIVLVIAKYLFPNRDGKREP